MRPFAPSSASPPASTSHLQDVDSTGSKAIAFGLDKKTRNNQATLNSVVAACITATGAFVTVYARNSFTVWSHTNPWDHGFSDVRVKQSFFSPEPFKLGKPTEFKVGKRRHRQSPYKIAYAQLHQREPPPFYSTGWE